MRYLVLALCLVGSLALISRSLPARAAAPSQVVSRQFSVPGIKGLNFRASSYTVACSGGQHVTGGGYRVQQNPKNVTNTGIISSYPASASGWTVRAFNGNTKPEALKVYALCSP